ncbi:hypothetical protein DAEQUDRAFT_537858 [Daedalea quercina L-15889]|uniref:Uncharacterized protein n=1 Tax=Daedalea quercina L-15889 TaxID=1314783 RepID=A0A165M5R2_9APHY|nr:hypothetical protein DAEQUDRAFT_537858 [Daedalea quercina L-15889]
MKTTDRRRLSHSSTLVPTALPQTPAHTSCTRGTISAWALGRRYRSADYGYGPPLFSPICSSYFNTVQQRTLTRHQT